MGANMKAHTFFCAILLSLNFFSEVEKVEAASAFIDNSVTDCESQVCQDCLGNCDGCDNCPLCELTADMCAEGGELVFGGVNVCVKCAYCTKGTEHCKKTCEEGLEKSVCLKCRRQCSSKSTISQEEQNLLAELLENA